MNMGRQKSLRQLKAGRTFDLIIIGGGATGCGVALDAATRGLDVALIEKNDFSCRIVNCDDCPYDSKNNFNK